MESLLVLAPRSGPGEHLTRRLGSLAALYLVSLSSLEPDSWAAACFSGARLWSFLASAAASLASWAGGVGVGAPGLMAGDWGAGPGGGGGGSSWAEAGLRAVLMLTLLLLLLGASEMAVILTTLTELTWGVGITVLMGLLVMSSVGGERRVMAPAADGLGRIWA